MDLKQLRRDAGLTQAQVAAKLNTDQKNVWQWEAGQVTPSTLTVSKLAEIYDVSADKIIEALRL